MMSQNRRVSLVCDSARFDNLAPWTQLAKSATEHTTGETAETNTTAFSRRLFSALESAITSKGITDYADLAFLRDMKQARFQESFLCAGEEYLNMSGVWVGSSKLRSHLREAIGRSLYRLESLELISGDIVNTNADAPATTAASVGEKARSLTQVETQLCELIEGGDVRGVQRLWQEWDSVNTVVKTEKGLKEMLMLLEANMDRSAQKGSHGLINKLWGMKSRAPKSNQSNTVRSSATQTADPLGSNTIATTLELDDGTQAVQKEMTDLSNRLKKLQCPTAWGNKDVTAKSAYTRFCLSIKQTDKQASLHLVRKAMQGVEESDVDLIQALSDCGSQFRLESCKLGDALGRCDDTGINDENLIDVLNAVQVDDRQVDAIQAIPSSQVEALIESLQKVLPYLKNYEAQCLSMEGQISEGNS
jgi:hypothetical protein